MNYKLISKIKERKYFLIQIIVIIMLNIFALYYSGRPSLTGDELANIGFVRSGFSIFDTLWQYMTVEITNLPLFAIILFVWYRIVPYGEIFMMILSILITNIGLFYFIKLCNKVSNEKVTTISIIFMATSSFFISQIFTELRAYCLLFTLSNIVFYYYIKRNEEKTKISIIKYTISLIVFSYTHYYAIIMCVALYILDMFLVIRKKIKGKTLISYIFVIILFFPWLTLCITNSKVNLSNMTWR